MKAIGYIRVSTEEQAREGISLDAQEAKIKAWAAFNECEAVTIYRDEGISGKKAANRPGLQSALQAAGKDCALVVLSLSRLSRSLPDMFTITERLDKSGADLVSLTEKIDTTTAAGRMIFNMLTVLNQFEREQIAERTRDALRHKRAQGFKTGGDVPFGFRLMRGGRLEEHPAEQKALRHMKELRAKGYTLRAIAAELEREGYRTRRGLTHWQAQGVKRIIERAAA